MRAALDRLLAEGTVTLPADVSLEDAVSDGLSGRLPVTGELGQLYRLSAWCRKRGFRSGFLVYLAAPEGVQVPSEAVPPGAETAISVSAGGHGAPVLLVERPDYDAGIRSYALRTVRQEFARLAGFLFADVSIPEGQHLRADADMQFRFGPRTLKVDNSFVREAGAEEAIGQDRRRHQQGRAPLHPRLGQRSGQPHDQPLRGDRGADVARARCCQLLSSGACRGGHRSGRTRLGIGAVLRGLGLVDPGRQLDRAGRSASAQS